jgi:hypothetical protein
MTIPEGRSLIFSTNPANPKAPDAYNLYCNQDSAFSVRFLNVCIGDFQAAAPQAIATVTIQGMPPSKGSHQAMTEAISSLNSQLISHFGTAPVPVGADSDQLLQNMILALTLFMQGNTVQVK